MAFTASYELPAINNSSIYMYRATGGGTVFTQIPYDTVAFDYFSDSAVVNDAFYFTAGTWGYPTAGLQFNVGTTFAASSVTVVWEYYRRTVGWTAIPDLVDNTSGFTMAGSNYVKYPQLWQPALFSVNGISAFWVRCRITAVSSITEGGANQTDTVKYGKGLLTISGTTDEVPTTFTEIYNWIKANESHISVTNGQGNSFDFTMVGLKLNSRTYTTNEIIELGVDCNDNILVGGNTIAYLTSGIKLNETTGYGGSTIIIYGKENSNVCNTGSQTKMYGTTIRTGKYNADIYKYAGFFRLDGEYIDCNIELSVYVPFTGDVVRNVRMVGGYLVAMSMKGVFDSVNYLCTSTHLFYVYREGWTLTDFGYQFRVATAAVFYIFQGSCQASDYTWKLINPSTPLNTLADNIKPVAIAYNQLYAIEKLWYYDVSAGTYTDYTAEAASATADDVPLSGDVGDMFYFGMTYNASSMYSLSIYIEKTMANNDYVYKWEYYKSGAWHETDTYWDACENLGKTGNFFTNNNDSDNVNINGHTTDYLRATIMTKGAGSPLATKIQQKQCSGVSKWNLKEVYSFDLKVVDIQNNSIDGATVTGTDENGVQAFSVDTNASGEIVQQELLKKWWYFDPVGNPISLISENLYSEFIITIKKAGYQTYKSKFTMTEGKDLIVTLKRISINVDSEVIA